MLYNTWIQHYAASDVEAPDQELKRIWSTDILPLLPGPLWPRVFASDWVLFIGQIEEFDNRIVSKITDIKLNC